MKPVSDRTLFLLWVVGQKTERDWSTGKLSNFFVPQNSEIYYHDKGESKHTYISGSGDASSLRGLEKRGLIERPKTSLPNKYVYALTEKGLQFIVANGLRERFEGC